MVHGVCGVLDRYLASILHPSATVRIASPHPTLAQRSVLRLIDHWHTNTRLRFTGVGVHRGGRNCIALHPIHPSRFPSCSFDPWSVCGVDLTAFIVLLLLI